MNKNFFDFLVATDELDEFLGYEPNCPECGEKLVKIVYGFPSNKVFEQAEKKQVYLGGCEIDDNNPTYHCYKCDKNFYEDLTKEE